MPFTTSPPRTFVQRGSLLCSSATSSVAPGAGAVKYFVVHNPHGCQIVIRQHFAGCRMIRLGHVNIRSASLADSVAFYRDVLDLMPGPAATRPGSDAYVWMHDGAGNPCLHLQLAEGGIVESGGAGLHHIAFDCENPGNWRRKLERHGIAFQEHQFANGRILQFNLLDPDGVRIELTFTGESA
jgi:catechol 2,3-dioxygenase-like lactoylglutathione lyase family enzyme